MGKKEIRSLNHSLIHRLNKIYESDSQDRDPQTMLSATTMLANDDDHFLLADKFKSKVIKTPLAKNEKDFITSHVMSSISQELVKSMENKDQKQHRPILGFMSLQLKKKEEEVLLETKESKKIIYNSGFQ